MLTLYHNPRTRSSRIVWLLEELGAPYEIERVSITRPDGSGGPDPKNPHPDGQVPAIVHDGNLVTETIAIVLYLTDAFPAAGIAPVVGDPKRGDYLTWLVFYAATMEPGLFAAWTKTLDSNPAGAKAYAAMNRRLTATLSAHPYILGDKFSAADIVIGSVFQWARNLMPPGQMFDDYLARINDRPAAKRAAEKD